MRFSLLMLAFILIVSGCTDRIEVIPDVVKDVDGNLYRTVKIGRQVWMAENLKVAHYRNGVEIPRYMDNRDWSGDWKGACSDYEFVTNEAMGLLYNWAAVQKYNGHNLAPEGWHIPSEAEWRELVEFLGGESRAGSFLKDTLYWSPVYFPKSLVTGFKARPAGRRNFYGEFDGRNETAFFWSTSVSGDYKYHRVYVTLYSGSDNLEIVSGPVMYGFSVRCIRD